MRLGNVNLTDLVVGLGEIGKPIYDLLKIRNFKLHGYDVDKSKNITPIDDLDGFYDMIHICIPFDNDDQFDDAMILAGQVPYRDMTDNLVIHSTVNPGTSARYDAIYSPIRGVHNNMLEDLQWFTKYYSSREPNKEFEKRFPRNIRKSNSTKLETTKINDLKYYGLLIAFTKFVNRTNPVYWDFSHEQHQRNGTRPVFYDDDLDIGGHCIRQNSGMLGEDDIVRFIEKWGGHVRS
jgi:hypothetical protein